MDDVKFMARAIELAKKGVGAVDPNPLVGAVIVKDGQIIGEGYHERIGGFHAERNALSSLKEDASGAVMYVTLEPCCHYGKTPPCTQVIIENKISKVVIGSRDPNPKVHGKGVGILRDAGIEVVEDFLKEECDALNERFFHYISTGTPYVAMKYAMTADGKIATKTGASKWISGEKSRARVAELRNDFPAIMAGIGTVLSDDPRLTSRIDGGRDPVRIICDSDARIPMDSYIVNTAKDIPTYVVVAVPEMEEGVVTDVIKDSHPSVPDKIQSLLEKGVKIINVPDSHSPEIVGKRRVDLRKLMKYLGEQEISGVLLEGGAVLNYSSLMAGIVQEIYVFTAPKIFGGKGRSPVEGEGIELPDQAFGLELKSTEKIDGDVLLRYKVINGKE